MATTIVDLTDGTQEAHHGSCYAEQGDGSLVVASGCQHVLPGSSLGDVVATYPAGQWAHATHLWASPEEAAAAVNA